MMIKEGFFLTKIAYTYDPKILCEGVIFYNKQDGRKFFS